MAIEARDKEYRAELMLCSPCPIKGSKSRGKPVVSQVVSPVDWVCKGISDLHKSRDTQDCKLDIAHQPSDMVDILANKQDMVLPIRGVFFTQ